MFALIELRHHAEQRPEALHRNGDVMGGADAERPGRLAGGHEIAEALLAIELIEKVEEDCEKVHTRAVDLDSQLEVEPIRPVVRRSQTGDPLGLALDDAKRVALIDVDLPAEDTPAGESAGREGAEGLRSPVGADEIFCHAVWRGRDRLGAPELHRAQPLHLAPRLRLDRPIPLDGLERAAIRAKDARALVARSDAGAAVIEHELDERHEHLVDLAGKAVRARHEDVVGEEPHAGDARRLTSGSALRGGRDVRARQRGGREDRRRRQGATRGREQRRERKRQALFDHTPTALSNFDAARIPPRWHGPRRPTRASTDDVGPWSRRVDTRVGAR